MKILFDPRLRIAKESETSLREVLPTIVSEGVNIPPETLLIAQANRPISIRELDYNWYNRVLGSALADLDIAKLMSNGVSVTARILGNTQVLSLPSDRELTKSFDIVSRLTAQASGVSHQWRPVAAYRWKGMSARLGLDVKGLTVRYEPTMKRPSRWPELQQHRQARHWYRNFMRLLETQEKLNRDLSDARLFAAKCNLPTSPPPEWTILTKDFAAHALNTAPRSPFAAGDKTQPIITTLENT